MSEKPVAFIKALARYKPDTVYIGTGEYVAECVRADDGDYYLASDVDAEIEALRAEVNGAISELLAERNALWESLAALKAENKRLREAVRRLCKAAVVLYEAMSETERSRLLKSFLNK